MLNDAILEVEKLNAVQQLTATITMVSMMTNEKDRCVQCQEHGYIVRHCPNIRCFECDEYGHIVMDCVHIRLLFWEPQQSITNQNCSKVTMPGQVPDITMRTETGEAIQGLSHIFTDTTAPVARIPTEAIPDHDIGIIAIITGVGHTAQTPHTGVTAIDLAVTLHIDHTADHPHTEAPSYHSKDRRVSHSCLSYKTS